MIATYKAWKLFNVLMHLSSAVFEIYKMNCVVRSMFIQTPNIQWNMQQPKKIIWFSTN